jgi:hypothetical protein
VTVPCTLSFWRGCSSCYSSEFAPIISLDVFLVLSHRAWSRPCNASQGKKTLWPLGNGNRRLTHVDVPDAFSVIMAVSITQGVRPISLSLSQGKDVKLITSLVQSSLTTKKRSRKITFVLLRNFKDPVSRSGYPWLQGGTRDE